MIQFAKPNIKLNDNDLGSIMSIIESGWFCRGEYVKRLEQHFKDKFEVKYAIACANCTSGLVIAFKATGIRNMRVAIPSFTWPSTLFALECNNNTPIWCDIEWDTWQIDEKAIPDDVDAVIPVDIFGSRSYVDTDLPVIYDAAHGYGLTDLGHRGLVEVVSLSFTKPVTAMQGGMILTNSDEYYKDIQEMVNLSAKMCEVNAYIGLLEVKNYEYRMEIRDKIIALYKDLITIPYVTQKIKYESNNSTFAILPGSFKKQGRIAKAFQNNNIEVKIYYEPLVEGLSNTDELYRRIIALPVYEEMIFDVPKICKLINEA